MNYNDLNKLVHVGAVRDSRKLGGKPEGVCGPCQFGKQVKSGHKQHASISKVMELLHMDLRGPMTSKSIGGRRYAFIYVDDFSRFTWVEFLKDKFETFEKFRIVSDHGMEYFLPQYSWNIKVVEIFMAYLRSFLP